MRVRRWIFLGLWTASLVGITCFGGAVSYGFFFGMSLLPLVSLSYIACVYFRFKIYQEIGSRTMVCGCPESYFFILKNEDFFAYAGVSIRLFLDFSYVEELPGDTEYELLPGTRHTFETRLVCRYRGEYEVGVKEVVVTDFLRLFQLRYSNPGTIRALVSPRVVSLTELQSLGEFQAVLRREIAAETEPDTATRDYVQGDSPKLIHWKATARTGELKVRTRTGEERQGITIYCDMKRVGRDRKEYLPLENRMLEIVLALTFFFAGKDMGVSVCYGQNGLVERRIQGMEGFEDFYREMDSVMFLKEEDNCRTLEQALSRGWFWNSKVVFFVLREPDEGVMELTRRLEAGGVMTVLYAVTDSSQEACIRQGSERRKIVQVPPEAELEGIL